MAIATLTIVLGVISFLLAFAIGSNDETFASVVGVKRLSVRTAVLMGAIIAIIGGFLLSDAVGKTLRDDISPQLFNTDYNIDQDPILISIYVAMAISLILASVFGLPISSTEALVGSILGLSIALGNPINWKWSGMAKVLTTWITSPIIGFTISFLIMKLVRYILGKTVTSFRKHERANSVFGILLLVMVVWTGLSRAGNDINNAIAPIVPLFDRGEDLSVWTRAFWIDRMPLLIGGIGLGLGLIVIGWRVLKTLGNEVVELTPESAFVTEGSAAIVVFFAVIIGIPVSGTMVLVSSFLGAGVGMNKPIKMKTVWMILLFIVLTPIISGLMAVGCYYSIRWLF
ncbi:MAG: inorganic phosphate transporter [Asgard group archaeon]|nr:inorganic phosphate transporter [Asgard group archaeon]